MEKKKVVVIGAGLSGLSAAIYSALSGFDVTILEQHNTFGGVSTSWSRKGYFFEGGMHWLTGSNESQNLNKLWHETGTLRDNNPIDYRDPYYTVWDGQERVHMYRDLEKMRDEFLAYAPEDAKMIKRFYRDVKAYMAINLVTTNIRGLKSKVNHKPKLSEFIAMLPAGFRLKKLTSMTHHEYVSKFKNKNLRHLLLSVNSYDYNATSFVFTVAAFCKGDNGYPKGGSLLMGQNMVNRFTELGGKILYRTKAQKIVTENGHAIGVQTKDSFVPADAVIVTQDAMRAVTELFDEMPRDKWIKKMLEETTGEQNIMVSMGVKMDMTNMPVCFILPMEKPFEYAGMSFSELRINNYAKYEGYAPEGGTSLTCLLLGENYEFWKAAKEDGTYKQKKDEVCQKVINEINEYIPGFKDAVEVTDVATPCTYERYVSSYRGSWMTVWEKNQKKAVYPQTCEIEGVYFAGQRLTSPGGSPIALFTGRQAVQYMCRDWGVQFM